MSHLTVEVEIDHGRVLPKGVEMLPDKAFGLLTIISKEFPMENGYALQEPLLPAPPALPSDKWRVASGE